MWSDRSSRNGLRPKGFDLRAYSLRGGAPDECLVLNRLNGGWDVFYSERGQRNSQRWFKTEAEACEYLRARLIRDPTARKAWRDRTSPPPHSRETKDVGDP
jgi:hypothetical protein